MKTRVLVVDDDDAGRLTLEAVLEDAGFEVASAGGRSDLEELLRVQPPFDVALLDYHLDGELGTELIPLVIAHSPRGRRAMLTGSERPSMDAPVDAWLTKGNESSKLIGEVSRLAARATSQSGAK